MASVLDIITESLKEIGVLASGETATAADSTDALTALNNLMDQWAAERLQIFSRLRTTATLTPNQASFTVGTGGNINMTRPVFVDQVHFIDTSLTPDIEYPMDVISDDAYANIAMKDLTSNYPQVAYYNPTYPLGTLIPWPIPTSGTLLWALYTLAAVSEFAALADPISLPPGYRRLLVKNLALELCSQYGREPTPLLVKQAQDATGVVKRMNRQMFDLAFDKAAIVQGRRGKSAYNIYQG